MAEAKAPKTVLVMNKDKKTGPFRVTPKHYNDHKDQLTLVDVDGKEVKTLAESK